MNENEGDAVMLTQPFKQALPILETIINHGYEAYFVGGCVRDLILERDIHDIDIATSASPYEIQQIFEKVIPVGIEHGTVIVRHHHESYEVTTFRIDGKYSDQRHPDAVEFVRDIHEDLKRRDFTMNALAIDIHGRVIDLFKGSEDINQKMIRTVGNSYDRLKEDPLRIIRALRFSSQLGFNIAKDTLQSMQDLRNSIQTLATERILNEFEKLIKGTYINSAFQYLKNLKIDQSLPIFKEYPALIGLLREDVQPFRSFAEFITLFHQLDGSVSIHTWVKSWKCSNKTKHEAIALNEALIYFRYHGLDTYLLYLLPQDLDQSFLNVLDRLFLDHQVTNDVIKTIRSTIVIESKRDLLINGNDLIKMYPDLKKGKWMQDLLQRMEKAVVLNEVRNTKYELKEWIKCNPPVIN